MGNMRGFEWLIILAWVLTMVAIVVVGLVVAYVVGRRTARGTDPQTLSMTEPRRSEGERLPG